MIAGIILMIIATVGSSLGAFLFKKSSGHFSFHPMSMIKNVHFVFGVFFYGSSAVLSIVAYKYGELTVLVPIASLNYIWTALLARYYLNERMNSWKWTGVALIMIGLIFIGLGGL